MAPKKEKAEKVSASAQEDMVFEYLIKQNRPYSVGLPSKTASLTRANDDKATEISANLHNKVTKSATQKILLKLHEAKKIEGRVSGKQSVYHAIQDPDAAPTPEELEEMSTRTTSLNDSTATLRTQEKQLQTTLKQLTGSLSTTDLRAQVEAMQAEKASITTRLNELRSGSIKPVSKAEKEEVEKRLRMLTKTVAARKRIVKEMWGFVADSVGKEDAMDLREDFGVDV